jgi:hypothetical protein
MQQLPLNKLQQTRHIRPIVSLLSPVHHMCMGLIRGPDSKIDRGSRGEATAVGVVANDTAARFASGEPAVGGAARLSDDGDAASDDAVDDDEGDAAAAGARAPPAPAFIMAASPTNGFDASPRPEAELVNEDDDDENDETAPGSSGTRGRNMTCDACEATDAHSLPAESAVEPCLAAGVVSDASSKSSSSKSLPLSSIRLAETPSVGFKSACDCNVCCAGTRGGFWTNNDRGVATEAPVADLEPSVSVEFAACGMGSTDAVSGRKRCRPASSSALACRSDAAIAASAVADAAATAT